MSRRSTIEPVPDDDEVVRSVLQRVPHLVDPTIASGAQRAHLDPTCDRLDGPATPLEATILNSACGAALPSDARAPRRWSYCLGCGQDARSALAALLELTAHRRWLRRARLDPTGVAPTNSFVLTGLLGGRGRAIARWPAPDGFGLREAVADLRAEGAATRWRPDLDDDVLVEHVERLTALDISATSAALQLILSPVLAHDRDAQTWLLLTNRTVADELIMCGMDPVLLPRTPPPPARALLGATWTPGADLAELGSVALAAST